MVADKVITLQNIGNELMTGSRSDRTASCSRTPCDRPSTTRSGRPAPPCGWRSARKEYDQIRSSIAAEASGFAPIAFNDAEFSKRQSGKIYSSSPTR